MENEEFKKVNIIDLPECFIDWINNAKFFEKEKLKVYRKLRSRKQHELFQIEMNTKTNKYCFTINTDIDYLCCTSQRKNPKLSEGYIEKIDLPNGKLNLITFKKIMTAIVFYEAERINYKKFKLSEIVNSLKKGHIVTREKWNFKQYIYYNREKLPQIVNEVGSECYWVPNIEDLEAEDWVDSGFLYTGPESLFNIFRGHHDRQI